MMLPILLAFLSLALLGGLAWKAGTAAFAPAESTGDRLQNLASGLLLLAGVGGFLCSMFSAIGWLPLPSSLEWPVGRAEGVLQTADGRFVVPVEPSGRVQVYDQNLRFQRGWNVDSVGGGFDLSTGEDNTFWVFCSRRDRKVRYDLDGILLAEEPVDQYPAYGEGTRELDVPTSWWLLPFTTPAGTWLMGLLGAAWIHSRGTLRKNE